MTLEPLVIYGAGGHAREIADLVRDINADERRWELAGFACDDPGRWGGTLADLPVLGGAEWVRTRPEVRVAVAIGSPAARRSVVQALSVPRERFPVLRHPGAVVSRRAELGAGVTIAAGCIVTVDVRLGDFVLLNRGSGVSHDCRLGDFATLAPGAQVAGAVTLGSGCDIGIGAAIIQGLSVGDWTVVGAGAAVVASLPANCTAVGVPARVIKQHPNGWQLTR